MLVSVHIPKTGGMTFLKNVLEPAFGDRVLCDYGDRPMAHGTAERNAHALRFVPGDDLLARYDCVHGHFLTMKYANAAKPCKFVCWLRDPVQRVVSRFLYSKRNSIVSIKDMTFTEYCRWERHHNMYAKYLWGFDIERFDFVGITEDYERSLDVFRRRFGIDARREELAFNANPDKDIRQAYAVSGKEREFIERTNTEDRDIYERGKRHLDRLARSAH